MLVFEERGKTEYPEKHLSEQGREPTTNSTHIWRLVRDSNPEWIGGRRALSPLRHPYSPAPYDDCIRYHQQTKMLLVYISQLVWPLWLLNLAGRILYRELTFTGRLKCWLNPWITHWALALVKGIREPHEVKKKSFDLSGNRTQDLRIRSTVTLPTELSDQTEKVGYDFRWRIVAKRK